MLIRSGEAPAIGWSRNMLYSGFNTLHRSVFRRPTGFAARITRTLYEHMNTRQFEKILSVLEEADADPCFVEVHNGRNILPLTDHIRCLPDGWTVSPSQEVAQGRTITAFLSSKDLNTIYCLDENSGQILVIDSFEPWPPILEYGDWEQFKRGLYDSIGKTVDDSVRSELGTILGINL